MAAPEAADVDPVVRLPFKITRRTKIVTAGSCFAQHIARYLSASGFKHHITERGHPILTKPQALEHNYGIFSARYGNIYTSRQLKQLFQRALGQFKPQEPAWSHKGRLVDPFRPTIQPGGFHSLAELEKDREKHLACVLKAMESLDVFVFTLGLTEAWESVLDGAAFPLCPGVEGGTFDSERHRFLNLGVEDVVADMREAIALLRSVNTSATVVLTVSPVPLAATAINRHVLVSTTLSKAVLRVAAETVSTTVENVAYFPSYEIITGNHARGAYFGTDLRSVTEQGVEHVMGLFFRHAAGVELPKETPTQEPEEQQDTKGDEIAEVLCEEALLDA